MDERTQRWRQVGNVYLWRYVDRPHNYHGFHCTADAAGCASLIELLNLMHAAEFTARNTIQLTKPGANEFSVVGYPGRTHAPVTWTIETSREKYPPQYWSFVETDHDAKLTLGHDRIADVIRGLHDVAAARGDYNIGDDDFEQSLWFWWQLK